MVSADSSTQNVVQTNAPATQANEQSMNVSLPGVTTPSLPKKLTLVLDDSNFLFWKQQIMFTTRSRNLQSYLDGTATVPSPKLYDDTGAASDNPDYLVYVQQDAALASWLLTTISPKILPSLVGCHTASEIWDSLHKVYAAHSTQKIMHLHCLL